jgi:hypothetical protein
MLLVVIAALIFPATALAELKEVDLSIFGMD